LTFYKLTEAKNLPHTIERFDTLKHDYQQLLKLVYLSGHDSRFKKDLFFGEEAFKSLYKQWIDNNLKAENTKVLVYQDSNKLLGFIAMKEEHSEGFIDLIAVSPEAQGQGVGQQLIDAVEASLGLEKELYVPTQQTNEQACHFYEKCGFKISDKQYIYHYAKPKHTL
jgi:dTDP-4-amino-4,6-dideoxy-D-galactose acyltransferase